MIENLISLVNDRVRRLKSRKGQTLVEYALIIAFISVVAISVLIALGGKVTAIYSNMTSQMSQASSH
jgi:Flp pilus assembly pilin Flp